jgi:hypothetical protein
MQLRTLFDELEFVDGASWKATIIKAEGSFTWELHRLAGAGLTFLGKCWDDGIKGVAFICSVRGNMSENIWLDEQHSQDKMPGLDWTLRRLNTEMEDAGTWAQELWSKYGDGQGLDPAILRELKKALATCMLLVASVQAPAPACPPFEIN